MGGYASQEVTSSTCQGSIYDEIILAGLKIQGTSPCVLGRFFIEVQLVDRLGLFALFFYEYLEILE